MNEEQKERESDQAKGPASTSDASQTEARKSEPGNGPSVTHANQLRGERFKALIRRPVAWILITVFALLPLIGFAAAGIAAIGVVACVIVVLIGLLVVFLIADNQAEDAFYDAYCSSHGLTRVPNPDLGRVTPLLRKGDKRRTDEIFHGELADGMVGDLALFTYTVESRDSDGDKTETDYPFTVVHVEMPEVVPHLAELRVQNKVGFKFLEGFEDSFRRKHQRVTLESEAMRDRYEIFVLKEQDAVWVRRLFSPSFIVWLSETPPKKFAFELEDGHLIAYVPKHKEDVEGFEEVTRVGTYVARRLLEESADTSPMADRETT